MSLPATVVIVGRTNVGKSSLFNRLSTTVKSLTLDYAGVTRDFLRDTACWKGTCFNIVDTGGLQRKRSTEPLCSQVHDIAMQVAEQADLLLFVVDGSVGLVQEDHILANMLRKKNIPLILVINKIDVKGALENSVECERLGFLHTVTISCQHATGINDLLDAIITILPTKKERLEENKQNCNIVLLGKPNVGKSSLLNALLQRERTLVSDIPGTTREAITEHINFHQEDILVTDTPGIRKKHSVQELLEELMVKTSFRALDRADIVLLLIDTSTGILSDQELKLAFYAFQERSKALIILCNKNDLADETTKLHLADEIKRYKQLTNKIEIVSISCKTGKNIGKIIPLVHKVWRRHTQELSAHELTIACSEALDERPLFHKTERLKLFRVRQVSSAPITLLMIVNQPKWFGKSQLAFFDTVLRKKFDLAGVPLKFIVRTS